MNFSFLCEAQDLELARFKYEVVAPMLFDDLCPDWGVSLCSNFVAWRLAVLLRNRTLRLEYIELPEPDADETLVFYEGGPQHRELCARSAAWMRDQDLVPVLKPRRYSGHLADVADVNGTVFVECGWTDYRKMLDATRSGAAWLYAPFDSPDAYLWTIGKGEPPRDVYDIDVVRANEIRNVVRKRHIKEFREELLANNPGLEALIAAHVFDEDDNAASGIGL